MNRPLSLAYGGMFVGVAALVLQPSADQWTTFGFVGCAFAAFVFLFDAAIVSRLRFAGSAPSVPETQSVVEPSGIISVQLSDVGTAKGEAIREMLGIELGAPIRIIYANPEHAPVPGRIIDEILFEKPEARRSRETP
jgi:hypothetical protein